MRDSQGRPLPIFVDVDDVLAEFNRGVIRLAREYLGLEIKYEEILDYHWLQQIPKLVDVITHATLRHDFAELLDTCPGSIVWLRELEDTFGKDRVLACTRPWSAEPDWLSQRARWLRSRGVPISRQIQTDRKDLIPGHLIDDSPANLEGRGVDQAFLIARPWNKRGVAGVPRGDYTAAMTWLKEVAS